MIFLKSIFLHNDGKNNKRRITLKLKGQVEMQIIPHKILTQRHKIFQVIHSSSVCLKLLSLKQS
jgi:hypothetical protein